MFQDTFSTFSWNWFSIIYPQHVQALMVFPPLLPPAPPTSPATSWGRCRRCSARRGCSGMRRRSSVTGRRMWAAGKVDQIVHHSLYLSLLFQMWSGLSRLGSGSLISLAESQVNKFKILSLAFIIFFLRKLSWSWKWWWNGKTKEKGEGRKQS